MEGRCRTLSLAAPILVAALSCGFVAIAFLLLPTRDWLLRLQGHCVVIEQAQVELAASTPVDQPVEYTVRNLTAETVQVVRVRPCCGARVISDVPFAVPPQASRTVQVQPPMTSGTGLGTMEVEFFIDRQSPPLVLRTPLGFVAEK